MYSRYIKAFNCKKDTWILQYVCLTTEDFANIVTLKHALYFIRSQDKVENFCACKFELTVNVHYFPGGSQDINDVVVFNYVNLNEKLYGSNLAMGLDMLAQEPQISLAC